MTAICGQEIGSKKESLTNAKKYPPNHTLMIGDAPGDYNAAVANDCLFFPINPGVEEASCEYIIFCDDDNWLNEDYLQRRAPERVSAGHHLLTERFRQLIRPRSSGR